MKMWIVQEFYKGVCALDARLCEVEARLAGAEAAELQQQSVVGVRGALNWVHLLVFINKMVGKIQPAPNSFISGRAIGPWVALPPHVLKVGCFKS